MQLWEAYKLKHRLSTLIEVHPSKMCVCVKIITVIQRRVA